MAKREIVNATQPLALITGASSGIGLELAKVFARYGYNLLVVAEDEKIFQTAEECKRLGAEALALQIDLAEENGVEELYQHVQMEGNVLDAVCLNAGVGVSGAFSKTNIEEELNMINLNIVSTVKLAKLVLQDMLYQGTGRILFTSSIAADMPGPYYAVYAASKSFIQSFAEALRFEVKDQGITVTALQPGATDTNFFARAHMLDTPAGRAKKDDPADVALQAYKALLDGKDHVVAGSMKNNFQSGIARLMPETMQAQVHASSTKPFSEKH